VPKRDRVGVFCVVEKPLRLGRLGTGRAVVGVLVRAPNRGVHVHVRVRVHPPVAAPAPFRVQLKEHLVLVAGDRSDPPVRVVVFHQVSVVVAGVEVVLFRSSVCQTAPPSFPAGGETPEKQGLEDHHHSALGTRKRPVGFSLVPIVLVLLCFLLPVLLVFLLLLGCELGIFRSFLLPFECRCRCGGGPILRCLNARNGGDLRSSRIVGDLPATKSVKGRFANARLRWFVFVLFGLRTAIVVLLLAPYFLLDAIVAVRLLGGGVRGIGDSMAAFADPYPGRRGGRVSLAFERGR